MQPVEHKSVMGKHACFLGTPQNLQCWYGVPHEDVSCRGPRFASSARNDMAFRSMEPDALADNCVNIDFLPCLNAWAVVQYVAKYATKAPKGSQRLGDVLQCSVDEVCKYGPRTKASTC